MIDYTPHWHRLIASNNDIQGGVFLTVDGMRISSMSFSSLDDQEIFVSHCAELGELARQLTSDANLGEFDTVVLEGKLGYLIMLPILDKALLAVLARKQAKLGLVILDMRGAIESAFGPGLATEPITLLRPPQSDSAHAKPE